ncbi:MAG: hypothetical protein DI586_03400 [Micavibrio aeruginosavorus]|uniref:Transcriptional regulator AbiEi antitoxin N-terminal domain-containing protein n=1 Tax=Micavibrio aeruginosavorus TaxID=349221 RepID=A0A2W5FRS9_9BACT|nr:MAG: hypothetical protein DI586_03400 [Micavibrio aeruginosavorus]
MVEQKGQKLNQLYFDLPEGMIVDSHWLNSRGYASNLRAHYIHKNWLEQPARSVYQRPRRGELKWEQVVISLQTLLLEEYGPLVVGGETALELQGFSHYISQNIKTVHLYGPKPPPNWLYHLPVKQKFVFHADKRLFGDNLLSRGLTAKEVETQRPWGQWDDAITLSSPERAILELIDELPDNESFHKVDKIMEGLPNLSPRKLQKLLSACKSIKVNRLFFFFADRHKHAWLKQLNKQNIDFGSGKRRLVEHGKLDNKYLITVPEDLDGLH